MQIKHTLTDTEFYLLKQHNNHGIATPKKIQVAFIIAQEPTQIKSLEGSQTIPIGGVIITGLEGEHYGMSPQSFTKKYCDILYFDDSKYSGIATKNIDSTVVYEWISPIRKISVRTWAGNIHSSPGDYIVRYGKDDFGIIKPNLFAKLYSVNLRNNMRIPLYVGVLGELDSTFIDNRINYIKDKKESLDLEIKVLKESDGASRDEIIKFSNIIICSSEMSNLITDRFNKSLNEDICPILLIDEAAKETVMPKLEVHSHGKNHTQSDLFFKLVRKLVVFNNDLDNNNNNREIITLESYFLRLSALANDYQTKVLISTKRLFWIIFGAVGCMEAFHNLAPSFHIFHYSIYLFALLLLAAVSINKFYIVKARLHEKFIESRSLSEVLRTQLYLLKAGIMEPLTNKYIRKHRGNLLWLKLVLNNILFYTNFNKQVISIDIEPVVEEWIDGQINYYSDKTEKREEKLEALEKLERNLYKIGIIGIFIVILLLTLVHGNLLLDEHIIEILEHFDIPHILLLISGMLLVSAAFIGEKYVYILGLKEDINDFKTAKVIFEKALILINNAKNDSDKQEILIALASEALDEQGNWTVLHFERRPAAKVG